MFGSSGVRGKFLASEQADVILATAETSGFRSARPDRRAGNDTQRRSNVVTRYKDCKQFI